MSKAVLGFRPTVRGKTTVYKQGALYPIDPLELGEMQEVTLTLNEKGTIDEDLAGYFTPDEWSAASNDPVTWDEVRVALVGIAGSLSAAVIEQRQER